LDAENWAKINRHTPERMGAELFEKWESVPDRERHEILQARELLHKHGNGSSWLDLINTGIAMQRATTELRTRS
jgi:hypothetical protein